VRLLGYVRTSSEERDGGGQEFAIYKWAGEEGHQVVEVFRDIGVSGVTPLETRPGWGALMSRLSEVDGVIVESLDRISRDPGQLLDVLRRLEAMGKVIISVSDNGVNQLLKITDPDLRRVIIDIASILIKQERKAASERTREKLAKLKAEGKRLGRPPKWSSEVKQQLIQLVERGFTLKEACRIIGVNYGTALRYLSNDPDYLKAKYTARLSRLMRMQELNKTQLTQEAAENPNLKNLN
jgi:DNA invertase Pin-like site-specific DNA recombinase